MDASVVTDFDFADFSFAIIFYLVRMMPAIPQKALTSISPSIIAR
jgi:hypothetical protein